MQEKDKYARAEDVVRLIDSAVRSVKELGELGARLGGRQVRGVDGWVWRTGGGGRWTVACAWPSAFEGCG